MDRRAEAQAAALAERISPEDFYRAVGANLDSSHAVFKALWVRDEEPDVWNDAALLMSPGSYVLRHATGVVAVDPSNASSLALLDPRTKTWSPEALDATGIDPAMLPELGDATQAGRDRDRRPSPRPAGSLPTRSSRSAAATRWRPRSAPASSSRARCATWWGPPSRSARRAPSRARTRRCSSSAIPTPIPTPGCSRTRGSSPAATCAGGATSSRSRSDGTKSRGSGDAYDQLSEEASRIPAGSDGVVFLPAMQGAMAPEWNGAARGVFYGLTLAHTRDHMTRAILEGSAFALRDILEAMKAAGLGVRRLTIVGGGAKGPLWRQIKADVTGLPVRVPESVETTATGAAILAAVGSGVHATVGDAVKSFVSFRPDEHEPDPERGEAYDEAYRRYREVYFALKPVFRSCATRELSAVRLVSPRTPAGSTGGSARARRPPRRVTPGSPAGASSRAPSSFVRASLRCVSASSSAWRVSAFGSSRKASRRRARLPRRRPSPQRQRLGWVPRVPVSSISVSIASVASRTSSRSPLSERQPTRMNREGEEDQRADRSIEPVPHPGFLPRVPRSRVGAIPVRSTGSAPSRSRSGCRR